MVLFLCYFDFELRKALCPDPFEREESVRSWRESIAMCVESELSSLLLWLFLSSVGLPEGH